MTSIKYSISNLEHVISVDVCKAEERVDQDSWDIEGPNKFQQLDWGVKTMAELLKKWATSIEKGNDS